MTRITPLALIGVGLLSLGTLAQAQQPAPAQNGPGARAPMDRTGLQSRLETMFDSADANDDGMLSVEERKARRQEARGKMQERMFSRLDANKDGAISQEEFAARHGARRGPGGETADGKPRGERAERGERAGKWQHSGRGAGRMMMPGKLAEYKDKPIPRAVFIDAGLARFDRMDADGDGKISQAEREAARKALMERRQSGQRPATPTQGS